MPITVGLLGTFTLAGPGGTVDLSGRRPTLTLAVSLEAILLSTFVMISQNRTDEKRAVLASAAWDSVQREESKNVELIDISHQILELTEAVHQSTAGGPTA